MRSMNRRTFLRDSALMAAALGASGVPEYSSGAEKDAAPVRQGGNGEKTRIAVIGVRGQGLNHVRGYAGRPNAQIVAICDVDEAVIGPAMQHIEKVQGKAPRYVQDLRKVFDDKGIDAVSIATPNHWHALAAIWAMQAGKDVYVEKPVSHNISEGRRMVEAARKYNRICQAGTQSRSSTGMRDAMAYLHAGKIGKVSLARGVCYKLRPSIGKVKEPTPIPKTIDYDLWSGPAPVKPLMRQRLHYDWHWIWDYGNGDLGNQGIHEMDKARWGLGKNTLPRTALSLGGRFGYSDDGETANTQLCLFDYGDCELIFEVRGLPSASPYPKGAVTGKPIQFIGNIWYGTEGTLVCPDYTSGVVLDPQGTVVTRFDGKEDHIGNFLKAVASRKASDLNGDILEGHLSSALCHLANLSYRLGTPQPFNRKTGALGDDKEAAAALERIQEHLGRNQLDVNNLSYRLGRKLQIEPGKENFVGDKEADAMLTREYRKGFEVPETV
jgi:predicted dehydrogenase